MDFITEANCMLNVESGTIELSRPQRLPVRFVSWERPDMAPFPAALSYPPFLHR